jgi:methionyl-tRNA formyltransferase
MKIVFFGSSNFSVPSLKSIASHAPYVVTKKAKPKGRGYSLDDNDVKKAAIELDLPLLEIESFKDDAVRSLEKLKPDLFVVVSFGLMLPKWLLELPALGAINVHPSLLPKYRGPSPIQWAILNGDNKTGTTIMKMVEKMDAGNIIYQESVTINEEDDAVVLSARLSERAAEILPGVIDNIKIRGMIEGIEQKNEEATYTPIITKEMGKIDWYSKGAEIIRQVKAFVPWPTAYTFLNDILFKIFDGKIDIVHRDYLPGTIFGKNRDGIQVATVDGSILVKEVQLENRKRVRASEFANGYRGLTGTILK